MYIVVFRAKINTLDAAYYEMAANMRSLALSQYNCINFTSCTEKNEEIALSYWKNLDDIHAWKNDINHLNAQQQGKELWYESYSVEVAEVIRQYSTAPV